MCRTWTTGADFARQVASKPAITFSAPGLLRAPALGTDMPCCMSMMMSATGLMSVGELFQIIAHRLAEPHLESMGHQCLADRDLIHTGHRRAERPQILEIKLMSRVDPEAHISRSLRCLHKAPQHLPVLLGAIRPRIRLGIELHAIGAHRLGSLHCGQIRFHEQTDADTKVLQVS